MSDEPLIARAAAPFAEIINNIKDDQLDASTPCSEYDVRELVNHLLFWGPSLAGAARKEAVPPVAESDRDVDLTEDDWAAKLLDNVALLVGAWREPAAWEGVTQMGGPMHLPASMVGGMAMSEFVVHGWDLARATGQQPRWDDEVLAFTYQEVARTAEQGREMGAYAAPVPVPATSSTLDRVLGLTGRDPSWTP